jgi:hypothetical protein
LTKEKKKVVSKKRKTGKQDEKKKWRKNLPTGVAPAFHRDNDGIAVERSEPLS